MKIYVGASVQSFKKNQDRAEAIHLEFGQDAILAIADGIGSVPSSEDAAEAIVNYSIDKLDNNLNIGFDDVFLACRESLIQNKVLGASTLILGKADSKGTSFAWCGNGCILHLRGHFWQKGSWYFPFALVNLLNPHIDSNGALYRYLSADTPVEVAVPSQLQLFWDSVGSGDIVLIASDGLGSSDELVVGKDDNDVLWERKPERWVYLFDRLNTFLLEVCSKREAFQDLLCDFIKQVLKDLKKDNLLEDDIALGIIITERVLNYYEGLREVEYDSADRENKGVLLSN